MTLNRSMLSVPGQRQAMHAKALASPADVVMFDLEDSVPLEMKETARQTVIETLKALPEKRPLLAVRINSLDTPFGFRDALEIAQASAGKVGFLVLPKVNHEGDIHFLDRLLSGIELETKATEAMGIEAAIETARGLDRVSAIARASIRLRSLSFGVADYTASVTGSLLSLSGHGEDEDLSQRWHFPLSRMIMAAKANGLLAMDAPFGNFKAPEGLRATASQAKALGCDGKWVIHPDQIGIVNQVFSPTPGEINLADQILAAADGKTSTGAIAVDGKMIDQATVRLARQIRARAEAIKGKERG